MNKLVLSTVITLLLRVAQVHTRDHHEIKSSVLDADISSSRTIAYAENLVPDATGSSSSSHDASFQEAIHGKMLRSNIEAIASTFNLSVSAAIESPLSSVSTPELLFSSPCDEGASSSVATRYRDSDGASSSSLRDKAGIIGDIEPTAACSRSNFKSIFILRPAAVASVSSSDVTSSCQSTATEKTTFQFFSDGSSDSVGTVESKQEQMVVESTSLEVSALPQQITDSSTTAYISTSTHPGNDTISLADHPASSTNEGNETSSSNSALFYSFFVLGIAGLVCAVLVYSIKWRVTARNSIMTPTSPTTWTPPSSEVHIVMHSRNVAVL
ncbi:unnamed protein product [Peronospora destructor]|uniref:Uncharacterized protein n=1 Tax=Peronospora destructor TaxID=86335 RepID=A0AAV0VDB5_9STRA|nr:unnamed protein product [Peronospora destructor]